ncbi:unnamed protein product [Closterium sp. Naga37s-1]|nr:unnamed protein product [Closterium sp. Naga37s-1]
MTLPSSLKSLNLSMSSPVLRTVFSSASPFTALEELLIIECSELETFPDCIGDLLPCLRNLTIRNFTLPSNFGHLPTLKLLALEGLRFTEFPPSFCHLMSLEALSIVDCNELLQLRAGFCRLTALKALCLSSLRVDISHLSQLRVLKLNCVGVICGPAGSSRLSCLQQLEQLEMRLDRGSQELPVPLTLMFLPRLRSLLIEAPGMCNLSGNLGAALPQLRQLTLFLRSSEELPGSIAELNSLTSLRVNAPLLTSLPQGMSRLSRLRKLELIHCHSLQHLPESLTQLHQLILQYTPISSLPAGLRLI